MKQNLIFLVKKAIVTIETIKLKQYRNGHSVPWSSKSNNLCCTQVQSTNIFNMKVTSKMFNICNKLNCKRKCLTYLIECMLFNKQNTGKSETWFNLRLNKHWKVIHKTHFKLTNTFDYLVTTLIDYKVCADITTKWY